MARMCIGVRLTQVVDALSLDGREEVIPARLRRWQNALDRWGRFAWWGWRRRWRWRGAITIDTKGGGRRGWRGRRRRG